MLLLYTTVLTVIGYKSQVDPAHCTDQCGGVGILGIVWGFGAMIFVLVYCTAGISGGHINPAVTFWLIVWVLFVVVVLLRLSKRLTIIILVVELMSLLLHGYSKGTGLGAEIIGTFVLVYTVFSTTDPKRNACDSHFPVLAPLPIGFAVFMVHLTTIPITGTGINSARRFGAAVMYGTEKAWDDQIG